MFTGLFTAPMEEKAIKRIISICKPFLKWLFIVEFIIDHKENWKEFWDIGWIIS
jgi:hypothetical protein